MINLYGARRRKKGRGSISKKCREPLLYTWFQQAFPQFKPKFFRVNKLLFILKAIPAWGILLAMSLQVLPSFKMHYLKLSLINYSKKIVYETNYLSNKFIIRIFYLKCNEKPGRSLLLTIKKKHFSRPVVYE